MKIDQKPRKFEYINHKDNSPLELTGNMKARSRPQSSNPINKINGKEDIIGNNIQLINKIKDGYQDLKSVLPTDFSQRKQRQSIKTYQKQKYIQVSGAALLMVKSKLQKSHPQKKHLIQRDICENINNSNSKSGVKQKRHYHQIQKQKQNKIQEFNDVPRRHTQTLHKKLDNDLYSKIYLKQNINNPTVRMSGKNMFREGVDLGYDNRNNPKLSQAKKRELIGSDAFLKPETHKNYRQDWIKSSFALG